MRDVNIWLVKSCVFLPDYEIETSDEDIPYLCMVTGPLTLALLQYGTALNRQRTSLDM